MSRFNKPEQVQSDAPPFRWEQDPIKGKPSKGEAKSIKKMDEFKGKRTDTMLNAKGFRDIKDC